MRFVQVYHGGGGAGAWDAHGNLKGNHSANSAKVDRPIVKRSLFSWVFDGNLRWQVLLLVIIAVCGLPC